MNKHSMVIFSSGKMIGLYDSIPKKLHRCFLVELVVAILLCNRVLPGTGIQLLQLLLFLSMGIFNGWLLHKAYKPAVETTSYAAIMVGAGQFIVMLLWLLLVQSFVDYRSLSMAFAGSAAFFFPLLVQQAWKMFVTIPANMPSLWYLPETASQPSGATSQPMLLQLQVKRQPGEELASTYPLTVSGKLKLGKVFEKLVSETKQAGATKTISTNDKAEQPYGWYFFEIKWLGFYKRFLDPSLSLLGNKLKGNAKIVIVRATVEH